MNDQHHHPRPEEVEHLLRNAQLRDEMEPYLDEAVRSVNVQELPTPVENEFLASMLAWERAPVLPISKWFTPELSLPHPDTLVGFALHEQLWDTIHKLFEKRIVLDFTDHLSDRELYTLIYRDILPSLEKKIESEGNYLHWDCAGMGDDPQIWLRYYASQADRENWVEDFPGPLPDRQEPPYRRELPRKPL
jgi:hypothetical protein